MTIEQFTALKAKHGVVFNYDSATGGIAIEGKRIAVAAAHREIASCRAEVAALLRRELGLPDADDEIVSLTVPARSVASLDIQFQNYAVWFTARGKYFTPSADQFYAMRHSPEIVEGDELCFDFAHSVTVRKADGLLIAIDRKGRRCNVPAYSPYSEGGLK